MKCSVKKADLTHIPLLIDLMEEFYKESDYVLNRERAIVVFVDRSPSR
jgi:hypothetical protein